MPELPECESVVKSIRPYVWGRKVLEFNAAESSNTEVTQEQVIGSTIRHVTRVGKYIVFKLDHGYLVSHLRMTGQWIFSKTTDITDKHFRWGFILDDDMDADYGCLWFKDVRKFGTMVWVRSLYEYPPIAKLGVDGLDLENPKKMFSIIQAAKKGRRPIKNFLLDQRVIAGTGNIYASEALHVSGINPQTPTKEVTEKQLTRLCYTLCKMFKYSISLGGCSVSDHEGGSYQEKLQVYGRADAPCYICGTRIVKITQAGRGTFYCPSCQGEDKNEIF